MRIPYRARMVLRLRQVAFVARELAPVVADLREVLGLDVCHNDPGVGKYGLENALLPVGNQFIEVVAPIEENTAGGRYLDRRRGDGGYMLILQCDDHRRRRTRFESAGVRLVALLDYGDYIGMQVHPKDSGGTFLEVDEQLGEHALDPDGPWHPAGPNWKRGQRLDRVDAIIGADVQCDDPAATARRWAELLELPIEPDRGEPALRLDDATIRFVPCLDDRPEGLGGIELAAVDREAVMAASRGRGRSGPDDAVLVGGVHISLR
jgi:hypothetical protein